MVGILLMKTKFNRYIDDRHVNYVTFDTPNVKRDPYKNWCVIHSDVGKYTVYPMLGYYKNMVWLKNEVPTFSLDEPVFHENVFFIPFLNEMVATNAALDTLSARVEAFIASPNIGEYSLCTMLMISLSSEAFFNSVKQNLFDRMENMLIVKLLTHNNLDIKSVVGTKNDRVRFYAKYPHACPPQHIWYKVLAVEVPTLFHHRIREGGWVHIAHSEVKHWLWFKMKQIASKIQTKLWIENPYEFNRCVNIVKTKALEIVQKRETVKKQAAMHTVDIEDLFKMMPPCTKKLVGKSCFPKDPDRIRFVGILRKAGIHVDIIGRILSNLNDKYPHDPPRSLNARFSYKSYYENGYRAPYCTEMTDCCPFKGDKVKCIKLFDEKWPRHNYNGENVNHLWGPYNWILWILNRRAFLKARHQQRLAAVPGTEATTTTI